MKFEDRAFHSNPDFLGSIAAVLADISEEPNGTMVDIGCADGLLVTAFAHDHPGWTCLGVDVSRPNIEITSRTIEERGLANARAELLDIRSQPLPDADLISANSVYHVIDNPRAALAAAVSALRPGGWIVLSVPDRRSSNQLQVISRRLLLAVGLGRALERPTSTGDWAERLSYLTVIPTITAEAAATLLRDSGLTVVPLTRLRRTHPAQLGHSLVAARAPGG